jgi:hypothetical protein
MLVLANTQWDLVDYGYLIIKHKPSGSRTGRTTYTQRVGLGGGHWLRPASRGVDDYPVGGLIIGVN